MGKTGTARLGSVTPRSATRPSALGSEADDVSDYAAAELVSLDIGSERAEHRCSGSVPCRIAAACVMPDSPPARRLAANGGKGRDPHVDDERKSTTFARPHRILRSSSGAPGFAPMR
jgi:hypothetical protein